MIILQRIHLKKYFTMDWGKNFDILKEQREEILSRLTPAQRKYYTGVEAEMMGLSSNNVNERTIDLAKISKRELDKIVQEGLKQNK